MFNAIAGKFPAFAHFDAKSLYKVGHFLFFCLIAIVLVRNARALPISPAQLILLLLLLAVASEGMQLHLFNRTTRLSDLGIDAGGILLGSLLASVFKAKRRTRRSRSRVA
jgi:VanZ family protein